MANFELGVTRNPYHPRGKEIFAVNFHDLEFKVDDKVIEAKDVIGAFPHVGCIITIERDTEGNAIINSDGEPMTGSVAGNVEIIGKPKSCGCNMSKFKVPQWWDVKLSASS